MTPFKRKLILIFAALGLASASASSYVHYKLLTDVSYTSFCDLNTTMSCTQAYASRYGSLWGVPVAIGGVIFFTLVLLIAGVAGRPVSSARETAPAYVFALSTVGLAFVLYLAWASYFVLGLFCVLCVITYVSVIAIFIISGGATSFPMTALPGRAKRDVRTLATSPLALVLTLLLVVGAVTAIAAFPRETAASGQDAAAQVALPPVSAEDRAALAKWWDVQPKVEIPISPDNAKVLIVKFNDYQCPACKATFDAYKGLIAKYVATGQVKYVTKHYPLEAECNPNANMNHYASCEASAAVIMGRAKGTSAKLEDWIFSHIGPPMLTPAQVKDAARTVGGITDFDAQYPRALEEIKTDAGLGNLLGVNQTPTFYINGRKPTQILAPQHFEVLIELELQRTK
ncbi:MAG TPA: vitamin K epoxide reductase family protein [Vicinamibacterales bacterium]|jgi:uncharacterized membrane protein/protein-disulfide isomerase